MSDYFRLAEQTVISQYSIRECYFAKRIALQANLLASVHVYSIVCIVYS